MIMNPALDQKLCDTFPKIFAERSKPPAESAMHWGFQCGDGWFWLIYELCRALQDRIDKNPGVPQVVATAVKSKLATLRFHYDGGDAIIEGMVELAELLSYSVCETCGTTQDVGHTTEGWLETSCKAHRSNRATWKPYEREPRTRGATDENKS